ncbi:MAG: hypothetical protein CM1200mP26_19440 [Acidimicrobiales bacterium]|nr:MAG: hypothetical protein CM1200mP26_19440 [Acidimicrobiales bacterium]
MACSSRGGSGPATGARAEGKWLTITGRSNDQIIRAGENISAREVEMHLEAHQSISRLWWSDADDRLGERWQRSCDI